MTRQIEQKGPPGTSPGTAERIEDRDDGADGATARSDGEGVGGRVEGVKNEAREAVGDAKKKARELGREARERARGKADEVREQAERRADRWTTSTGRRTGSLARALWAASDSLRDEGEPAMADMAGQAAEQVDRMSGYLEDEDPAAMLHDLEDLGRRNPGAFVGSTFTMGLLLGRFLRSSRPEKEDANGNGNGNGPGPAHTRATSGGGRTSTGPIRSTPRPGTPTAGAAPEPAGTETGEEGADDES